MGGQCPHLCSELGGAVLVQEIQVKLGIPAQGDGPGTVATAPSLRGLRPAADRTGGTLKRLRSSRY